MYYIKSLLIAFFLLICKIMHHVGGGGVQDMAQKGAATYINTGSKRAITWLHCLTWNTTLVLGPIGIQGNPKLDPNPSINT